MRLRRQPHKQDGAGRRVASRPSRERGAALVEAAIILPVVITLLFGVIEYGFIFKDVLTISNATRAGARMAAADGNAATTDFDVLTAVKSGASALPSGAIEQVIIYKASAGSSTVPSACTSISGNGGVWGTNGVYCNVYGSATMNGALNPLNFGGTWGKLDAYYSPLNRSVTQGSSDYVGVYIRVNHNYFTGMFGASRTLADQTVSRVEPTA